MATLDTTSTPDTAFDRIDSAYALLRDAGFIVTLDGPSFLVGLKNRRVTTTEITAVLDSLAEHCTLTRSGPNVRIE